MSKTDRTIKIILLDHNSKRTRITLKFNVYNTDMTYLNALKKLTKILTNICKYIDVPIIRLPMVLFESGLYSEQLSLMRPICIKNGISVLKKWSF